MIKQILLIVVSCLSLSAFAAPFSSVAPGLETIVGKLEKYPETSQFIQAIEGQPITIKWIAFGNPDFNAFWSAEKRLVAINSSRQWTEGELLYSVLFELHNASCTPELIRLDKMAAQKQIGKKKYVEAVEKIEYDNVLKTSQLLESGVRLGYFPKNTYLPQYPGFKEHLRFQIETGHSGFIAQKYDDLGSLPLPSYLK